MKKLNSMANKVSANFIDSGSYAQLEDLISDKEEQVKVREEQEITEIVESKAGLKDKGKKKGAIIPAQAVKTKKQASGIKGEAKLRKDEIIHELNKELLQLGLNEGDTVECNNISSNRNLVTPECRGVLEKIIKPGLEMRYIFISPDGGIKDFRLNNVEVKFKEVKEEKLVKLLIVIKFLNSKYKEEYQNAMSRAEKEEILKQQKAQEVKEREAAARRAVLEKL